MKHIVLALVSLAFVVCGSGRAIPLDEQRGLASTPELLKTGIRGVVMFGPTCGVMPADPEPGVCEDRPFQVPLDFLLCDQDYLNCNLVKTESSDEDGRFDVRLAPGFYRITKHEDNSVPAILKIGFEFPIISEQVEVPEAGIIEIIVHAASGIL